MPGLVTLTSTIEAFGITGQQTDDYVMEGERVPKITHRVTFDVRTPGGLWLPGGSEFPVTIEIVQQFSPALTWEVETYDVG